MDFGKKYDMLVLPVIDKWFWENRLIRHIYIGGYKYQYGNMLVVRNGKIHCFVDSI